ncbi:MAG: SDR family oxidoreductase [Proteobacteria bacterium]|nr:SDR family oxidoreductase [Pseudomonadota bacterium]
MDVKDRVVVVTGGASGIGLAMCKRFAQAGARAVVVADLDQARCDTAAAGFGGLGLRVDVAKEAEVQALVDEVTSRYGQVDVLCSNAGIMIAKDEDATTAEWQRIWDINLMAHVHAARAVLPQMLARGEGYLVHTASAAGLLSQVNSAPYSVTKHAAVAFAEWLSIAHGDAGIRVSCLCPQGVLTPMLMEAEGGSFLAPGAVTPESVADEVLRCMQEERFFVLPHPEVATYVQRKAADPDRWIKGMRRTRAQVVGPKPVEG